MCIPQPKSALGLLTGNVTQHFKDPIKTDPILSYVRDKKNPIDFYKEKGALMSEDEAREVNRKRNGTAGIGLG